MPGRRDESGNQRAPNNRRTRGQQQWQQRNSGNRQGRGPRDGSQKAAGFCRICDEQLSIPFRRHVNLNIHKKRVKYVRMGCRFCGVKTFDKYSSVMKHRETDTHKENLEKFSKNKAAGEQEGNNQSANRSGGGPSNRKTGRSKDKTEEDPFPELQYKSDAAVGQNFVVPVSGFFCKLCHKFYNSENAARVDHCQSEQHFKMFKKAKIAARAKALRNQANATSTNNDDKSKSDNKDGDASQANGEENEKKEDVEQTEKTEEGQITSEGGQSSMEHDAQESQTGVDAGADEGKEHIDAPMETNELTEESLGTAPNLEQPAVKSEEDSQVFGEPTETDVAMETDIIGETQHVADPTDASQLTEGELEDKLLEEDKDADDVILTDDVSLACEEDPEAVENKEDKPAAEIAEDAGANVEGEGSTGEVETAEATTPTRGRGRGRRGRKTAR